MEMTGAMSYREYREQLRRKAGYRCDYCGVAEGAFMLGGVEGWGVFMVEHFLQEASSGLIDDVQYGLYICRLCNLARGVVSSDDSGRKIIHRRMQDYSSHLYLDDRGILKARSSAGRFSISALKLNDPRKVKLRLEELKAVEWRREVLPEIPRLLEGVARLSGEARDDSMVARLELLVNFIRESFDRFPGSESPLSLLVQAVTYSYGETEQGRLVHSITPVWQLIAKLLSENPSLMFEIAPHKWEELIAAAFDEDGYDHVILTPRSGDHGRDVIATKEGVGAIRIVGSVKAYKPGLLVRHDDVRALLGVLSGDRSASKGIITTTSGFAPNIKTDPFISPFIPYRLELLGGSELLKWFEELLRKQ